jgi:hypothetical protein
MITARRMRDRAEAERAAAPAPRAVLPKEIPRELHQKLVGEINKAHARELAALRSGGPTATFEIKLDEEPFKSAVADLVAEFEQRAAEVVAQVERLEAWKAALLPPGHKRPTLEEFVAGGYQAELYDERMLNWEAELVGAKARQLEAEVLELKGQLRQAAESKPNATEATPAEPAATTTTEPVAPAAAEQAQDGGKQKGGKPKPR